MFLNGLIQRKIASLLRPWLAEEPAWEVKLGLVRSLFVARNLRFDSSALNELIGAEIRLTVKEVTVEEVSVRVANWSSPALAVDVHGVRITLSAEERQDERVVRKKTKSAGSSLQEKKQLLAKIDPEGSAFHDNLEKLMISSSSESQLKTSLVNLIMRKCCLSVDGMHIVLEFPNSDETFVLLGDILDLKAESGDVRHGCLLGDLISLLVLPLRDSSVEISARTLQIRSNWKSQDRCIFSCIEPCIGIELKDLCLLDFMLLAPDIVFQISPAELDVITKFDVLNPSDTSHCRNGQQLWKLARTRVCHTIFPRRYLLYQVMNSTLLSLRLVKAYQYFLVLIGYHTEIPSHKMAIKMPRNGKFSKLAKEEWSLVCKYEEELPAEAIAWARRVARGKLLLGEAAEDNFMTPGTNHIHYFNKIFLLLLVFWRTICKILEIFRAIFFLKHSADAGLMGDNIPEDCILLSRIRLNFGNISVLVHPADPIQFPSYYEQRSGSRISYSDICSFRLTIKGILFVCEEGVCEEYISLSMGLLQVASIPVLGGSGNAAGFTKNSTDYEEYWKQRSANSRDIAWGLPAPIFFLREESESGSRLNNGSNDMPFREKRLGEVEAAWRRLCSMFQKSDMLYSGYPFLFCDIKSFWVHPGLQNPGSGLFKCHLGVGKLNLAFRYSEVLSVAVVLRQMQHSFHEPEYSGSNMVHAHPSWTDLHLQRLKHLGRSNFNIQKLKMTLFELLPEKSIELDVLVAGPHVRLLWREEEDTDSDTYGKSTHGQEGFDIMFDFHNINLVVWPTSEPTNQKVNNMDMKNSRIEAGADTTTASDQVKYVSQGLLSLGYFFRFDGLNAYLEDSREYQKMQIMLLKSITIELSTLRDYVYFFGAATAALSAASSGCMEGGFVFFYVDELSLILQQDFQKFFSIATAYTVGNSYFNDGTGGPASAMNELPTVEPEIEGLHDVEGVLLRSVSSSFMITSTFQIEPFNIILHGSKSNNQGSSSISPNSFYSWNHGFLEFSPSGIWLSTCKIYGEISCMGDKAEMDVDLVGFRVALFKTNDIQSKLDQFEDESDVLLSLDCLYEASLSSCKVSLLLGCIEDLSSSEIAGAADRLACSSNIKSFMVNFSETSDNSSSTSFPEKETGSSMLTLAKANWLLINLTLDIIFVGSSSIKKLYASANPSTVFFSISDGGVFQILCLGIQDGHILVEPTVLSMFGWCLSSYFNCIGLSFSAEKDGIEHRTSAEPGGSMVVPGKHHTEGNEQQISCVDRPVSWENVEASTINLSQLSITLLSMHEKSGGVQKLTGTVDLCLSFWPQDGRRMVLFNMSLMQLLSKRDDANEEIKVKQNQIPCFSHGSSSYLSTKDADGDFSSLVSDHASCSFSDGPGENSLTDDSLCHVVNGSKEHIILKELSVLVSAQKLETGCDNRSCDFNQGWDGSGSLSGFDMTLSLLEIEMLMETVESLSEVFSEATSSDVKKKRLLSFNLKPESDTEASIPDGSIVAIQDVRQHMYITVVNEENDKFSLSSTIHYSLVGERALFRVKSQKQRRWNFRSSCFSLESLFAKNDKGEPLQLDYCSGSGFVGISSTSESAGALWKVVSCRPESSEVDTGLEPFSQLYRNTFHLINRKNDCGVALVDGTPEFVRKPGNQFKLKIFSGSGLAGDIEMSDTHPVRENGPNSDSLGVSAHKKFRVPCVWISMENAMLTIVHELSDNNNKFPLFKGCANGTKIAIQVLPRKTRVMSALTASLLYFDAHNILWRELLHPVEIDIFYRVKCCSEDLVTYEHGIPVSLHIGLKRLDISLTEIALDILLYVIGKLNFAGPFAVKSSSILANYCKVENHTEVNLHCHYDDSQDARVGRKQSVFFFLRNLADHSLEASYVSVKLEIFGSLSTSAVKLPLSGNQTFAWRTRIMSLQDSQTHPGPFIVFDIAKNIEEGLSVVVSPLLRIHNETAFSLELRFQRPRHAETESASMFLESGDTIDDCLAAFDAIKFSGPVKKALMSVSIGNFLFSFRPDKKGEFSSLKNDYSIDWSDSIKGGKAVRLSGIIEKLNYKVRRVFTAESSNYSFSIACCSVRSGEACVANLHFLVGSIVRQIPVVKPSVEADARDSMVALQEQKEIFLLPTVRVHNLLQLDVHVLLTEDLSSVEDTYNIGNQATVACGSTSELYANPGTICFTVTLITLNSRCKPVKSEDWLKKLNKQRDGIQFLDVDLEFGGGKYFASLRLNRGDKGTLEAVIYTSYTLKNDTEYSLLCFKPNQKPPSRDEIEKHRSYMPPYLGCFMPPKSIRSWFMKTNKLCLKLLDQEASESILDLDSLSGLAEISLAKDAGLGFKHLVKLGVSLGSLQSKMTFPLQVVSMVPRYIVSNDSDEKIYVKQCYLEDHLDAISIASKQRMSLLLMDVAGKRRQLSAFDKLLRKHRVAVDDSSMLIQFRIDFPGSDWSGPICVAALGRFYLKFKSSSVHQSDSSKNIEKSGWEFAAVHVVEEASSFVLHFTRISHNNLPYRIENQLSEAFIEYYQKDTFEPMTLPPGDTVGYVWDDSTRPHKLVVRINGADALREINLDKLRDWRPFLGARYLRDVAYHLHLDSNIGNQKLIDKGRKYGLDLSKIGYEVYADGPTRVLRICGFPGSSLHGGTISESNIKLQLRVSSFTIQLLERRKENLINKEDRRDSLIYSPIMVGKLENTCLDSIFGEQRKYNRFKIKLISVDQKWDGAPFASTLRMHQMPGPYSQNDILVVAFVLDSNGSNVKKFKYSSILLQPITIKLDEETLMKIVPFWRTSLSQSTESQQYYFDHFEIHPVKIIATFLPAESYSSYDSTQEALRSLLHSVIKMPTIENMVVELNGVLVTHALVTFRELLIKCAQHYSWYSMRAIYIAKGSTLLPPSFASVFDDLASSSLDVFFDPSNNLLNIRGLTVGSFKLISRCIKDKGLSGTKRYFGDLGKTLKMAGSNILFAAVTEISDSVLKGAESSGFNGMVIGFHHGILKLAMEPTLLRSAFLEGGPDRKIWLDRSPGVDELYIEGYLQAMLDTVYKQEYLRVRVIDNQVILKNLPPNSSLIDEIMDRVKDFLVNKALLKGDTSRSSRPLRHLRGENDWRIGPTIRTLCEHLFVSFAIRTLRKQTDIALAKIKEKGKWKVLVEDSTSLDSSKEVGGKKPLVVWGWGIGRFAFSAILAYIDGRLCRGIPNPVARRIVSGFLLSFLDRKKE